MGGNLTKNLKDLLFKYYLSLSAICAFSFSLTIFTNANVLDMNFQLIAILYAAPILYVFLLIAVYFFTVKPIIKEVEAELLIEIKWNTLLNQFNKRE